MVRKGFILAYRLEDHRFRIGLPHEFGIWQRLTVGSKYTGTISWCSRKQIKKEARSSWLK